MRPNQSIRPDRAAAPSTSASSTAPLLQDTQTATASFTTQSRHYPSQSTTQAHSPAARQQPQAARSGAWSDRAASMLRGHASLSSSPERGEVMIASRQGAAPNSRRQPATEYYSDNSSDAGGLSDEERDMERFNAMFHSVQSGAHTSSTASQSQSASGPVRNMARFLAEPDGPHMFLNMMRQALSTRRQRPNGGRYMNDALMSQWITEFSSVMAQQGSRGGPTAAQANLADAHFHRVTSRLRYLDATSLPAVSDQQFAEFARRTPPAGGQQVFEQQFRQYFGC